jgi:hypothetical protein
MQAKSAALVYAFDSAISPPMKFAMVNESGMDRAPKTRSEIERLVLHELRSSDQCEGAAGVYVIAYDNGIDDANWTLAAYSVGTATEYACELALQQILPRLQGFYDLVEKR